MVLLPRDILAAADHLVGMKFGMGTLDDMNHLKNKRIHSVADLLQDQFELALVHLENAKIELFGPGGLTGRTNSFRACDIHLITTGRIFQLTHLKESTLGLWILSNSCEDCVRKFFGSKSSIQEEQVHFRSIFSFQYFSIGASLIPFIEHNDANRALMNGWNWIGTPSGPKFRGSCYIRTQRKDHLCQYRQDSFIKQWKYFKHFISYISTFQQKYLYASKTPDSTRGNA
ncbi:DNA-directed RNA polymerase subunit beta [Bienertia sinuspersici]